MLIWLASAAIALCGTHHISNSNIAMASMLRPAALAFACPGGSDARLGTLSCTLVLILLVFSY